MEQLEVFPDVVFNGSIVHLVKYDGMQGFIKGRGGGEERMQYNLVFIACQGFLGSVLPLYLTLVSVCLSVTTIIK